MKTRGLGYRLLVPACLALLPGCAAVTAYDVATTPVRTAKGGVKAASRTYDVLTTSQSEKDQKRGRKLRKYQKQLAKLERKYQEESEDCDSGDREACRDRYETWSEMEAIRPYIPAVRY